MERFSTPRPDHSLPENLGDAELADAIDSLRRKLRSVRTSLRGARISRLMVLAGFMALGFALLWVGPAPFLSRIFGNGDAVTIPVVLAWWGAVIAVALIVGTVGYRMFDRRTRALREWTRKANELERRLVHAEAEAGRRRTA